MTCVFCQQPLTIPHACISRGSRDFALGSLPEMPIAASYPSPARPLNVAPDSAAGDATRASHFPAAESGASPLTAGTPEASGRADEAVGIPHAWGGPL